MGQLRAKRFRPVYQMGRITEEICIDCLCCDQEMFISDCPLYQRFYVLAMSKLLDCRWKAHTKSTSCRIRDGVTGIPTVCTYMNAGLAFEIRINSTKSTAIFHGGFVTPPVIVRTRMQV